MTELTTGFVHVGVSGAIGHIEICRPAKKNAMTSGMGEDLLRALRQLEGDAGCKAVVISGRGGDLSSGADLAEPRGPGANRRSWAGMPHARLLRAIGAARIPVITAIDGWAIGLGLGLVGAATYAVAGRGSRFSLPEIKSGYLPYAVLPHLVHRTPAETIVRWAVSGAVLTVDEASAAGLVTHVAEPGEALGFARDLATPFTQAPRALVEEGMAFLRESRAGGGALVRWCERQMDALLAGATAAGGDSRTGSWRSSHPAVSDLDGGSVETTTGTTVFPDLFWASRQGLINLQRLGEVPFPPDQVRDRMLITEAFYRFATGHDENRVDVVVSCMTDDVEFEFSKGSAAPFDVVHGRAALESRLTKGIPLMYGQRRHCMTNVLIESLSDAAATAYAYGIVSRAAQGLVLQATVMYLGELRKESDGFWRFSRFFIGMDEYTDDGAEGIPKSR
jgi:enoyl-CoA hydratase/carnithine racemase